MKLIDVLFVVLILLLVACNVKDKWEDYDRGFRDAMKQSINLIQDTSRIFYYPDEWVKTCHFDSVTGVYSGMYVSSGISNITIFGGSIEMTGKIYEPDTVYILDKHKLVHKSVIFAYCDTIYVLNPECKVVLNYNEIN